MGKVTVQGMGIFNEKLNLLASDIRHINNMALYSAAEVVANAVGDALQSLPVRSEKEYGTDKHKLYGATASEKAQIIQNFGVATFKQTENGSQTSIGFTGYVNTPSTKFNDRVPTGMLMQCIEYGTSFRRGTHTVNNAINTAKASAVEKAQKRLESEVKKIMD